jgi:hypothetical protein
MNPECNDMAREGKLNSKGTKPFARYCSRCQNKLNKTGTLPGKRTVRKHGFIEERGICVECGNPAHASKSKRDKNCVYYDRLCGYCKEKQAKEKKYGKKVVDQKYKFKTCEHCGFKAIHPGQLDIDHQDGNSRNNDPKNLQCLCKNCHALKTILQGDTKNRYNNFDI